MNTLIKAIENETNWTVTENNAVTPRTTKSAVLDFFSLGGAMRNRDANSINQVFSLAFAEDRLLALKCLAYLRDIRGGQGERKTFRTVLNFLGQNYPEIVSKNLKAFVEYGRWDDLFVLFNTPVQEDVLKLVKTQLNKDLKAGKEDSISLISKWLPSENTSSKETVAQAKIVRKFLKWDSKKYRKVLSTLRKKIDIVERKMCANQWGKIDYPAVPSRASLIYRKAFGKHDQERYAKYLSNVEKGKEKINASTLYPYDIVERAFTSYSTDKTLDLQWKALPDYCKDNPNSRGIVVADVSGSMTGRPMNVAISLAMYFAERNQGVFKDCFITFSANPQLQKVSGKDICEKVRNLSNADWGMNTNVQAVFDLILNTALKNKIKESEMPNAIYIISDFQFDQATTCNSKDNYHVIREKYAQAGYKVPVLIFWNVRGDNNNQPVTRDEIGARLVSGCSPVIFKTVLSGATPYETMLNTLNQKRYNLVKV